MVTNKDIFKTCWCPDCKNRDKLPNCPNDCDGIAETMHDSPVGYGKQ